MPVTGTKLPFLLSSAKNFRPSSPALAMSPPAAERPEAKTPFLEDAGDVDLEFGRGHLDRRPLDGVGVADAREHVGDRIGMHARYQLDFVMPGIAPWWARSRRQIRQRPNLR